MDPGPLFHAHPSAMLVVDPDDGRILAANDAAVRFYGWSRAELTSRTVQDLNQLTPDEVQRDMAAARAQERTFFAFRHRTAGGEVREVEVHSGPVELDGRRVLVSVVHDATMRHRVAAQLRESEGFSRAIVADAPVGIAVADLDGHLVRVNQAMCELTGYHEAELIGMDHRLLTHPDDRAMSELQAGALRTGETDHYRVEKRYLRRDRSIAEVDVSSTLVRASDGAPRFQVGVVLDRTAEHLARDSAARTATQLYLTMESVTDGIFIVDRDWTITYVNGRFQELLHVVADDVIGRNLWEAFPHDADSDFQRAYQEAMATGETRTVIERAADTRLWFEARAYPSEVGLVIYFSDVTERIQHQARLERVVAAERANAARLAELDAVKNAFLSAVSHELRTPLTVLRGLTETLVRLRGHLDPAERDRIEEALLDHSSRLAGLLDELLDVDRLARGTLVASREEVDLTALVREVAGASGVAERTVLDVPDGVVGSVDPVQISHLLSNLLSNAAKYAPDGSVRVRLQEHETGRVRLEVQDEGPGIPLAARQRAFDPFVRLDEDHPQPGTGLGLALVAEFARLHDGRAWIADAAGCRVVVELAVNGRDPDPR